MALIRPIPPLLQILVPALNGPIQPILNLPFFHRLSQPFRLIPTPFAAFALPLPLIPSIPSVSDIWEGILKAVPKKKTSHRKKRQRFMAGKGLKDLTSLNRCAACGRVKRAHILCTYCVAAIKTTIFNMRPDPSRGTSHKQSKQYRREAVIEQRLFRRKDPDPQEKKPILQHPKDWRGQK